MGSFWLPLSNRSSSEIRLGGHASFTIDYQDYQITAASPLRKQGEFADCTDSALAEREKDGGTLNRAA